MTLVNIEVIRKTFTDQSTEGELWLNDVRLGYTLEPRVDQSQGKPFAVPTGTYHWSKAFSQHFGFMVIKIFNIPGFEDIEIHPGNYPKDTHGCCLVGSTQGKDFVGNSVVEFLTLLAALPLSGTITYIGEPS